MRHLLGLSAITLALSASVATAAPTIKFDRGSGTLPTGTQVIENFDNVASGTSIGTNATALDSNTASSAIPAFGSTDNYGAVFANGSYSINFAPTSMFAFVVGSLDTFNTLELLFDDNTSITYHGTALVGGGDTDGNPNTPHSNGVVSYDTGTGPKIIGAVFTSPSSAFEFDNLSVIPAPEPGTWALLILGLGATGVALRRRSRLTPRAA